MNKKNKQYGSTGRITGFVLAGFSGLLLLFFLFALVAARVDSFTWGGADIAGGVSFLIIGLPCGLVGRNLIKKSEMDDIWQTSNQGRVPALIRRLGRIHDDAQLLEIGNKVFFDQVADAAFSKVKSQAALGEFIRTGRCSYDKMSLALKYLTDEDQLCAIVGSRTKSSYASNVIKSDAVKKMNDPVKLSAIATNVSIDKVLRKQAYDRLRTVTEQRGGNVAAVDEMIAKDRTMEAELRTVAYMRLQSAGKEGHRMLAEDQSMPPETRAKAYEWIGETDKADNMRRKADQNAFLYPKKDAPAKSAEEAGKRILATGDEDWIEANVKEALKYSRKGERTYMNFLVDVAKEYPDMIKRMWPQLTRWAHADATNHDDKHYDWGHTDWYSRSGYDRGKHYDFANSSDCTHSDTRDEMVHTDRSNQAYLDKFPPAARDGQAETNNNKPAV